MNGERERRCREILRYYPNTCLKEVKKITKGLRSAFVWTEVQIENSADGADGAWAALVGKLHCDTLFWGPVSVYH
jgi:hypothetical protein